MLSRFSWRSFKIFFAIVLLVMILMRLVWMELRTYPPRLDGRARVTFSESAGEEGPVCRLSMPQAGRGRALPPFVEATSRDWFASSGLGWFAQLLCEDGRLAPAAFIRTNQWLLILTVAAGVMLTRFLTSSWVLSLVVGASLLSRGRLIAGIGTVGSLPLVTLGTALWFLCLAHHLKTASRASLVTAALLPLGLGFFDPALGALSAALPLAVWLSRLSLGWTVVPLMRKLRVEQYHDRIYSETGRPVHGLPERGPAPVLTRVRSTLGLGDSKPGYQSLEVRFRRGSLLKTIGVPYLLYIHHKARFRTFSTWVAGLAVVVIVSVLVWFAGNKTGSVGLFETAWVDTFKVELPQGWTRYWITAWLVPFDLDMVIAMVLIALCALQSPIYSLVSFWEAVWLLLIALVLATLAAYVWDTLDAVRMLTEAGEVDRFFFATLARAPKVLLWFEPLFLSMGAMAVYNLLKVLDSRLSGILR